MKSKEASRSRPDATRCKKGPVSEETGPLSLAPEEGFEPPTGWLTATCSTAELLRIGCGAPPAALAARPGLPVAGCPSRNFPVPEFLGHGRQRSSVTAAAAAAGWRPGPESNRRERICSPLHHHSATGPACRAADCAVVRAAQAQRPSAFQAQCPGAAPDGRRHIGGGRKPVKRMPGAPFGAPPVAPLGTGKASWASRPDGTRNSPLSPA